MSIAIEFPVKTQLFCNGMAVELEIRCAECRGRGLVSSQNEPMPCVSCRGKGYSLTPDGEKLLGFIKRWGQ